MYPTYVRRLRPRPAADSEPLAVRVALDSTAYAEARMKQLGAVADAAIALAQSDGLAPDERTKALDVARKAIADQEVIARDEARRRLERALQAAAGPVAQLAALASSTATPAPTLAAVQGRSRRRGQVSAAKRAELDAGFRASCAAGAPIITAHMMRSRDPATAEAGLKAAARADPTQAQGFGAGPAGLGAPSDTETARAQAIESRAAEEPYPSA